MIRNKNIISFIVAIVLIGFLFSENIFSSTEKILEKEFNLEEEVELSEEDKDYQYQYNGTSYDLRDGNFTGESSPFHKTIKIIVFSNYNGLKRFTQKTSLFILYCCLKIKFE